MLLTRSLSLLTSMGMINIIGRSSTNIFDLELAKHFVSISQRAPSINMPLT